MADGTCTIPDCDRVGRLKLGMCEMHYQRHRAPLLKGRPAVPTAPKRCRSCGELKPAGEYARKGRYRAAQCKACLKAWAVEYRRTNAAKVSAIAKTWREANAAQRSAVRSAWWAQNAERVTAQRREKYKVDYSADPSPWHAARARRKQRRGTLDAADRAMSRAYRAAIRSDPCWYCGARVEGDMHDDHYFALAKGGTDHWWNLVRACGPCNRHKHINCGTWFLLRRGIDSGAAGSVPAVA